MAGKLRSIAGKIGRWLFGKPKPPKITGGHRGIAAGKIAAPNLDRYAERVSRGHEKVGEQEAEEFMEGTTPLFVMSSNVAMVQYHPDEEKMMVEFLNGSAYLYSNISRDEAESFLVSHSKGGWIWSNLRVRGSRTAHRKPYVRIK